jgi:hypothetical protein
LVRNDFDERVARMTERLVQLGKLRVAKHRRPSRHQATVAIALMLSVLVHGLALWGLMDRALPDTQVGLPAGEMRISVALAAPPADLPTALPPPLLAAPSTSARPAILPAPRQPRPRKIQKPLVAIDRPSGSSTPVVKPAAAVPPIAALPDDMSSMLEAARKRRAASSVRDNALGTATEIGPEEDETQRANRIVRANVAAAQIGMNGAERDQNGGVFQVRRLGLHNAEFLFRGWNTHMGRNSSQLVAVEQGTDSDIRLAVVRKMIELIRNNKTDEFIWKSHRLGKELVLSAKPEYTAELQHFLMNEFFPDYPAGTRFN